MQRKQLNEMVRQIRLEPTLPLSDSIVSPQAWVGTTNFNWRRPGYVIIHHTAQNTCDQTLRTFTLPASQVSAHYVICKDGTVHHMLHD
ncbi:MAG: N-acetylmuramoyl-L-alanine amidase, partial [Bacteroidota bacterium]